MNLDKLKKICKQATPGPWDIEQNGDGMWDVMGPQLQMISSHDTNGCDLAPREEAGNALFIAAARTMLPWLIAIAEAAENVKCSNPEHVPDFGGCDVPCGVCPACVVHAALAEMEME